MRARAQVDYQEFKTGWHSINTPGRTRRWTPEFAFDDSQLRAVIIHATLGYIFRKGRIPEDVKLDLVYLKELAANRQKWVEACAQDSLSQHWQAMEEYITAVRGCGGYMEMLGAVAYRAWRLNWHDRDIAASLAMQSESVKRVRLTLLKYAQRLGFPTYERRPDAAPQEVHELIARMFRNGATVALVAAILSRSIPFVRHSLRVSGLYALRDRPSPLSKKERANNRVRRCRARKRAALQASQSTRCS